jgi:hypothetical protein
MELLPQRVWKCGRHMFGEAAAFYTGMKAIHKTLDEVLIPNTTLRIQHVGSRVEVGQARHGTYLLSHCSTDGPISLQ